MNQIVPNDNCLTPDQILRYVQDDTLPVEMRLIDRHLDICPMCSDAIEGAMQLSPAQLNETFSNIQTQISDKTASKSFDTPVMQVVHRSPKRYWLMGAAASLALIATAGFWLLTQTAPTESKAVAVVESPVEVTAEPTALDTLAMANSAVAAVEEMEKNAGGSTVVSPSNPINNKLTKPKIPLKSDIKTPETTSDIVQNTATSTLPSEYTLMKKIPTPSAEKTETDDRMAVQQKPKERAISKDSETDLRAKLEEPRTQEGFDLSNNPTYQKAEKPVAAVPAGASNEGSTQNFYLGAATQNVAIPEAKSSAPVGYSGAKNNIENGAALKKAKAKKDTNKKVLSTDSDDFDYLKSGIRFYDEKNYETAIGNLSRVISLEKTGVRYEKALWYLANAYLKLGKKGDAKALFTRIVAEKGQFSEQAKPFLKE
jgi:hypothetical protein